MDTKHNTAQVVAQVASECIAVRVRLINRVISALYDDALRPFGLRINQGNILVVVARLGAARPTDVCRMLRIEKSTLSRDVEVLKKEGWIEADPPTGGRNHVLRVTPRGLHLIAAAQPAWQKAQDEARSLIGKPGENALHEIASRLGFGQTRG